MSLSLSSNNGLILGTSGGLLKVSNLFPLTLDVWTDYFMTQDSEADWATGGVRGVGRGLLGIDYTEQNGTDTAAAAAAISGNNVLIPVGGLQSARNEAEVAAFFDDIENDNGAGWKALVEAQTAVVVPNETIFQKVFWQLGNELNDSGVTANIHAWDDQASGPFTDDDTYSIPFIVEYFLAPTIEALRAAGVTLRGSNETRAICCTLAGGYRTAAQTWYSTLLNTTIVGTYASSLAGLKVKDVMDGIAAHYVLSPDNSWDTDYQAIQALSANGRSWQTEEIGAARGDDDRGGVTALRVVAHALDNAANGFDYPLTADKFKVNFWGWQRGTTSATWAETAMDLLYAFLGSVQVRINQVVQATVSVGVVDWWQLYDSGANKKVFIGATEGADVASQIDALYVGAATAITVYWCTQSGNAVLSHTGPTDGWIYFTAVGTDRSTLMVLASYS